MANSTISNRGNHASQLVVDLAVRTPRDPDRKDLPGDPDRKDLPGDPDRKDLPGDPDRKGLPKDPDRILPTAHAF